MRSIINLLRLQIDNHTDILKTASPRKMILSVVKILILFTAMTVGFILLLSNVVPFFGSGIVSVELIALILLIVQALTLAFSVAHVIKTLYLSKDNELLICLPVTANQFFISKVLLVYFKELAFNALFCIPLLIALGTFGGLGASYYCSLPIYIILLPVLPIVLASFISIPVMRVMSFFKRHSILAIVTLLIAVAGILWVYISLIAKVAGSLDLVANQTAIIGDVKAAVASIGSKLFIYYQLAQAAFDFSAWYYIPIFIGICAVLSFATVMIIRPFYFRIAMPHLENRVTSNKNKKSKFRHTSPFISLIKKEMLCIFRSSSEVFEYFLFTLLMPFIVLSCDRLLMTVSTNDASASMIAASHVMVVAILAMLSNISSASAVSRDGATFHTSKIIPVDYFTQIFAKLTFNAIFTLGAVVVTAIISAFSYPIWQVVLGSLAVCLASIGHIALSLEMDIKHPSVSMQGDEEASTTSKSTPIALIIGLVIAFVMGLFLLLLSSFEYAVVPYVLLIAISLIFALWRVWILILRVQLAYDKIEM